MLVVLTAVVLMITAYELFVSCPEKQKLKEKSTELQRELFRVKNKLNQLEFSRNIEDTQRLVKEAIENLIEMKRISEEFNKDLLAEIKKVKEGNGVG